MISQNICGIGTERVHWKRIGLLLVFLLMSTFRAERVLAVEPEFLIETSLSRSRISMAEPLEVTVEIMWPYDHQHYQIQKITPPESDLLNLEQASQSSGSRFMDGKQHPTSLYHYKYKAIKKGHAALSAFVMELLTENNVLVLKKGQEVPFAVVSYLTRYAAFAAVLGAAAAGVALFFFLHRKIRAIFSARRAAKNAQQLAMAREGLEKKLQDDLTSLKKSLLQGDASRYLRDVSQALSGYVAQKYGTPGETAAHAPIPQNWQVIFKELDRVVEQVVYAGSEDRQERIDRLMRQVEREIKQEAG